jgi:hypothetical protein
MEVDRSSNPATTVFFFVPNEILIHRLSTNGTLRLLGKVIVVMKTRRLARILAMRLLKRCMYRYFAFFFFFCY